jgi:hypothetical protein
MLHEFIRNKYKSMKFGGQIKMVLMTHKEIIKKLVNKIMKINNDNNDNNNNNNNNKIIRSRIYF